MEKLLHYVTITLYYLTISYLPFNSYLMIISTALTIYSQEAGNRGRPSLGRSPQFGQRLTRPELCQRVK